MTIKVLETERLVLRTWHERDAQVYWQIMQDPKMLEFLPTAPTHEQIALFIERSNAEFAAEKYCLFAAEEKQSGNFMGYVGLCQVPWEAAFTPAIEIGWRLGPQYWGKGYATEAASAVLTYAFDVLNIHEIIAFTVPANIRSQRVMEKIGMIRDMNGDFATPRLPAEHRLSKHVLYRIVRSQQKK